MPSFVKITVVVCALCAADALAAQAQPPVARSTPNEPGTASRRATSPPSFQRVAQRPLEGPVESVRVSPSPTVGAPAARPSRDLPPRSKKLPSERAANQADRGRANRVKAPISSLTTALGALAIVLGLFFVFAWMIKRAMPKGSTVLPGEVVEVLGRCPLAARQYVHLVRVGNKLLLVSVSATGSETLTEITDPKEVDRLVGICNQARAGSTTMAFRQVFQQFSREPTSPSFVDAGLAPTTGMSGGVHTTEGSDV